MVTNCEYEGCEKPQYKLVPPTGHDFDEPEYEWADDMSKVTATTVCKNDSSHVETEEALVSPEVTRQATCTEKGETTYTTAEFGNPAFSIQTKKADDIEPLGHELTAHPMKLPTYEEPGHETYWECSRCGKFYSDEVGLTEIDGPTVLPNDMLVAETDLANAEKALAEAEEAKAAADKAEKPRKKQLRRQVRQPLRQQTKRLRMRRSRKQKQKQREKLLRRQRHQQELQQKKPEAKKIRRQPKRS
jgi:hypothetical protein